MQRFIKEQIYRREREFKREQVALNGRGKVKPEFDAYDNSVKRFCFLWWDVRNWVEGNPEFNPGPYRLSESLERSTKRALYTLVKRGEIGCTPGGGGWRNQYMTVKMKQELMGTSKAIAEGFARMEAEGTWPLKAEATE